MIQVTKIIVLNKEILYHIEIEKSLEFPYVQNTSQGGVGEIAKRYLKELHKLPSEGREKIY